MHTHTLRKLISGTFSANTFAEQYKETYVTFKRNTTNYTKYKTKQQRDLKLGHIIVKTTWYIAINTLPVSFCFFSIISNRG